MGFLDRFSQKAKGERARDSEARGDWAAAAIAYQEAGLVDDAARVLLLLGDGELDPNKRSSAYARALGLAAKGTARGDECRGKLASLLVALWSGRKTSELGRHELRRAAALFEEASRFLEAAEVYRLIGDTEAEARALESAGAVDELEEVLTRKNEEEASLRLRERRRRELEMLEATGDRRAARSSLTKKPVEGDAVHLEWAGERFTVLLGDDELVVGRADCAIVIPAQAVSRRHLGIERTSGRISVRDLGSRNGTTLRGLPLGGEIPVSAELELVLGGEVLVRLKPSALVDAAVDIHVGHRMYVACLGTARLRGADLSFHRASDGWVEARSARAPFMLASGFSTRTASLVVGDELRTGDTPPQVLRVLEVG